MRESEKTLLYIRNKTTRELSPLWLDASYAHPAWVHEQLGTRSESELQNMAQQLDLAQYLLVGPNNEDASGIFVDIPNGALAWKLKDPFQDARWLFEEDEVVEALELDPQLVLRVGRGPAG